MPTDQFAGPSSPASVPAANGAAATRPQFIWGKPLPHAPAVRRASRGVEYDRWLRVRFNDTSVQARCFPDQWITIERTDKL